MSSRVHIYVSRGSDLKGFGLFGISVGCRSVGFAWGWGLRVRVNRNLSDGMGLLSLNHAAKSVRSGFWHELSWIQS